MSDIRGVWYKYEDMPEEWREEGLGLMVWGWPTYAAKDVEGTYKSKVVSWAKYSELMARPYGVYCNTHFTITHVALPLARPNPENVNV